MRLTPALRRTCFLLTTLAATVGAYACGSSSDDSAAPSGDGGTGSDDGSTSDATATDGAPAGDASPNLDAGTLTACPSTGPGAVAIPGAQCFAVTPAETGADPSGENATMPSFAITPQVDAGARGKLLLYFNGSGGTPGRSSPTPSVSFYAAASSLGYSVLAISYASDKAIGKLCATDGCYFPTRKSIILGVYQSGANASFSGIRLDEGIALRTVLALRFLAAHDPTHGWDSYLVAGSDTSPENEIAWNKVAVAGHSQGGGHAAVIGKLFPVARVVQLSSTCDSSGGMPISWTDQSAGPWASDPTQFYGLGDVAVFSGDGGIIAGDSTCPAHGANWEHLGMVADHRRDDAGVCGHVGDQHGESIACTDNLPAWLAMLQ